jgi:hypothetical protein
MSDEPKSQTSPSTRTIANPQGLMPRVNPGQEWQGWDREMEPNNARDPFRKNMGRT